VDTGARGGYVYEQGTLQLIDCIVTANRATDTAALEASSSTPVHEIRIVKDNNRSVGDGVTSVKSHVLLKDNKVNDEAARQVGDQSGTSSSSSSSSLASSPCSIELDDNTRKEQLALQSAEQQSEPTTKLLRPLRAQQSSSPTLEEQQQPQQPPPQSIKVTKVNKQVVLKVIRCKVFGNQGQDVLVDKQVQFQWENSTCDKPPVLTFSDGASN
jgi:hypothetical protein